VVRVEEQRRLVVADVRREPVEILDFGAEVAAVAAFNVGMGISGGRSGGEKADE